MRRRSGLNDLAMFWKEAIASIAFSKCWPATGAMERIDVGMPALYIWIKHEENTISLAWEAIALSKDAPSVMLFGLCFATNDCAYQSALTTAMTYGWFQRFPEKNKLGLTITVCSTVSFEQSR